MQFQFLCQKREITFNLSDGLLKSRSKTQQTDMYVASAYLATRIPHKSMDVILCVLGKFLCHLSHKRETQVLKCFMSFLSLNL